MCLFVDNNPAACRGKRICVPYYAYKTVVRSGGEYGEFYFSPYMQKPIRFRQIITSKIKIYADYRPDRRRVEEGLHFSSCSFDARRLAAQIHGGCVAYVLLLPGSRVIRASNSIAHPGRNKHCVTDKYVLFQHMSDMYEWWDKHWEEYTK